MVNWTRARRLCACVCVCVCVCMRVCECVCVRVCVCMRVRECVWERESERACKHVSNCGLTGIQRKLWLTSVPTSTSGYTEHLKLGSRPQCVLNASQVFPSWPFRNFSTLKGCIISEVKCSWRGVGGVEKKLLWKWPENDLELVYIDT